MNDGFELVKTLLEFGIPGGLLVIIYLLIEDPTRAEKLKALLLQPTFRLFRWGSKQYLAAKVGGTVSSFFRQYLGSSFQPIASLRVQIRWVSSPTDPILSEDGTLILCLEDSNDQTKNILMATRVALPHIVCPTLRPRISKPVQSAIDLAVLHKLADGIGQNARPLFQKFFLEPEVESERIIANLFSKLVELDTKGVFVFVFLEELNALGDRMFRRGDFADKTTEVEGLLEFLLSLARRELGEEIELTHHSRDFKVGIVLVAKTAKAQTQGLVPYLKAVDINVEIGCESIYLIGFVPSTKTFTRLLDALDVDQRFALEKKGRVRISPDLKSNFSNYLDLAFVRVIRYVGDASFVERLNATGIREGIVVEGVVLDVVDDGAVVDIRGLRCSLRKREASWKHVTKCSEELSMYAKLPFLIKRIDMDRTEVEVSRRVPDEDPWQGAQLPDAGDSIEITFTKRNTSFFLGTYRKQVEVAVPIEEMSWLGADAVRTEDFIGATENVLVLSRDDNLHTIEASVRLMEENPWPEIHKRFPKNTELRGEVCEVNANYVLVKLEDGLVGHIPRESMLKAGFEFADYEKNVVIGQGLDVVVTKVFLEKKRIRLDLKRNVTSTQGKKNK